MIKTYKFKIEEESHKFKNDTFIKKEMKNLLQYTTHEQYREDISNDMKNFYNSLSELSAQNEIEKVIYSNELSRSIGSTISYLLDNAISGIEEFDYSNPKCLKLYDENREAIDPIKLNYEVDEIYKSKYHWKKVILDRLKIQTINLIHNLKNSNQSLKKYSDLYILDTVNRSIDFLFLNLYQTILEKIRKVIEDTFYILIKYSGDSTNIKSEVNISSYHTGAKIDFLSKYTMFELKCKINNDYDKYIQLFSYYLLAVNYTVPMNIRPTVSIKKFIKNCEENQSNQKFIIIDAFLGQLCIINLKDINTHFAHLLDYLMKNNNSLYSNKYNLEDLNYKNLFL